MQLCRDGRKNRSCGMPPGEASRHQGWEGLAPRLGARGLPFRLGGRPSQPSRQGPRPPPPFRLGGRPSQPSRRGPRPPPPFRLGGRPSQPSRRGPRPPPPPPATPRPPPHRPRRWRCPWCRRRRCNLCVSARRRPRRTAAGPPPSGARGTCGGGGPGAAAASARWRASSAFSAKAPLPAGPRPPRCPRASPRRGSAPQERAPDRDPTACSRRAPQARRRPVGSRCSCRRSPRGRRAAAAWR
mmetsp:Transcript_82247/g.255400  ORF Transcript_82247/g.255400 Transcript_82247/m.255400 type:complete len:241 (-) Transcript_82247:612-1334(-)